MTTITEQLVWPAHQAIVRLELAGTDGIAVEGFVADTTRVGSFTVTPDDSGAYTVELPGNDAIVPAGTRWKRIVGSAVGGPPVAVDYLDVPSAGGPFRVDELLSPAPASIVPPEIESFFNPILSAPQTITYNPDGTVATVTVNGVLTTYTYNADGTVATETRGGVTRTYMYVDGNLTAII